MKDIMAVLKALNGLKTYDITPVFTTNMPMFSQNPNLWIVPDCRTYEKNGYYCQTWVIGEHVGSHIDAACHTVPGAPSIESYPADYFIAPYKKYALDRFEPKAGECMTMKEIKDCEERDGFTLEEGDIVLLQYGFDKYFFQEVNGELPNGWFGSNSPGLEDEVEEYFLSKKIRAIGADTNNCEIPQINGENLKLSGHDKYFLPNNIPIMENFVNLGAAPAEGIFMAFPLPVKNGSGSPVRAILKA